MRVQCKGSGRMISGSFNVTRAACPACGTMQDRASNGRIRKHMRLMHKRDLRKIK